MVILNKDTKEGATERDEEKHNFIRDQSQSIYYFTTSLPTISHVGAQQSKSCLAGSNQKFLCSSMCLQLWQQRKPIEKYNNIETSPGSFPDFSNLKPRTFREVVVSVWHPLGIFVLPTLIDFQMISVLLQSSNFNHVIRRIPFYPFQTCYQIIKCSSSHAERGWKKTTNLLIFSSVPHIILQSIEHSSFHLSCAFFKLKSSFSCLNWKIPNAVDHFWCLL